MEDSLNGNAFSMTMSGSFQDNYGDTLNSNVISSCRSATKRRRLEGPMDMTDAVMVRGKCFLPVPSSGGTYVTENWKPSGTSMFEPVTQDLFVNVARYDQVTAAQGSFHTAEPGGSFKGSVIGHVVHLWRHDEQQRKLYIALSVLYTNAPDFFNVQAFLQNA